MNIRIQTPSPPLLLPRAKLSSQGTCPYDRVPLEALFNYNLAKRSLATRCYLGWPRTPVTMARPLHTNSSQPGALPTSGSQEVSSTSIVGDEKFGVLLLNLGGPETLEDVQPFLFNLFADPDIIRLPRPFRFLQKPLAQFISVVRSPKSKEGYASIGGGSPLRRITEAQA